MSELKKSSWLRLSKKFKENAALNRASPCPAEELTTQPSEEDPFLRHVEIYSPETGGFPSDLFGESFLLESFQDLCSGEGPLVFWDLETSGLGDVPIFMLGVLLYFPSQPQAFRLEILTAKGFEYEEALLKEACDFLSQSRLWISFNGRSFDYPRLKKRAFRYDLEVPECEYHLDLLMQVRRRWKHDWPNCKLGTVERRLLNLERGKKDVPGSEVPERYNDYVATKNWKWMEPVLDHNRRDLVAMAVLLERLCEFEPGFLKDVQSAD